MFLSLVCFSAYLDVVMFFLFKHKTAYDMRISDWSSDVCSSDLPIRQALGVDAGGKVAFDLRDGEVIVTRADAEHEDPAIGAFLSLLARDIEAGRNVHGLPEDLARAMLEQAGHGVKLDEEIDGEVAL